MSLQLDHVVLSVKKLESAVKDFKEMGFQVVPGGKHGGGLSKNYLIHFQDGTFIELFALTRSFRVWLLRILHRFKFHKRFQYSKRYGLPYRFYSRALELPEGITDICFRSEDYTSDFDRINDEGIFLTKPLLASRKKSNGSRVKWKMFSPFLNELPFIRSAYEPKNPLNGAITEHPNGVTGIEKLLVLALDYKDTVKKYEIILGVKPFQEQQEPGKSSSFSAGDGTLEILKPADFPEMQEKLRGHGIGLYGLTFRNFKDRRASIDKAHGLPVLTSESSA